MKRRIVAAVMAVVLGFTFSGCTGSFESEPVTPTETVTESVTPTPTEPETTEPEVPEDDVDQLYLDAVRENYPPFNQVPDSILLSFADNTCKAFDEGASIQDIFQVISDNASNQREAEAFAFAAGAAVAAYCPEYTDKIPGAVDEGSSI